MGDRSSSPRFVTGVASAPDPVTPVTAIPAAGWEAVYPTTAVPAGGMDWNGPREWDSAVPYPRPPQWSGPPRPRRSAGRTLGRVAVMVLASLLGMAALVAVLELRTPAPNPQPSLGARPNAVAPTGATGPSAPAGDPAGTGSDDASPTPTQVADTAAVISTVSRSVVNITSTLGLANSRVAGTGVILSASGLVLTNNHVVAGATSISAVTVATNKAFQATVVGFDRSHDIAVLQLTGAAALPRIGTANSTAVQIGDPIIALGNAGGTGGTPTAVTGTVTALNQSITAQEPTGAGSQRLNGLVQIAADIRAGDSGGPLVDRTGRLIGINTAATTTDTNQNPSGTGFAVPSNTALAIAQQIQTGRDTTTTHIGPTALLGVSTTDGDQPPGAKVTGTLNNGPAQHAGITTGDTITAADGRTVDSAAALTAVLDTHHPDDTIAVVFTDKNGRTHTTLAQLITGPAG